MIYNDLTTDTKRTIWERQHGMCAFTGKKFEEFNTDIAVDFHLIKQQVSATDTDNVIMIFKSADLPATESNDFMKFQFPYANFKAYSQDEKLSDIGSIISKLKEDSAHGNDWKELRNKIRETFGILNSLNLDSDKSQPLADILNSSLESVISRQKEDFEKNQKEMTENYNVIKPKVDAALELSKTESEFRKCREALFAVQNEFKNTRMLREHKEELLTAINAAFEDLNRRQSDERENYEMECIENYHSLKSSVDQAIAFANSQTMYAEGRKALIAVQAEIKGKKLKREQRDELYQIIRDCFNLLITKQSEERSSMDTEVDANYTQLKKIVDESISFAENVTDNFKEARETLISAQSAIKGARLRKDQRDELYAAIRVVFERINERQSVDREQFEKECTENYSKLKTKVEETFVDLNNTSDFRLIRETLLAVQGEIRILKLTRDQRNELMGRIRSAFEIFDKRRTEYFDKRKEERVGKLDSIQDNLKAKIVRLNDTLVRDNEALVSHQDKLKDAEGKADNEESINNLKNIINSIEERIKEKQTNITDAEQRIADIEKEKTEVK